MPSNKKEGIIFGLFMCFGMVLIMLVYNIALQGLSTFTIGSAVVVFIVTFIVAFIVESIVEPKARKLALSLPYDKSSEINIIVAISVCMVPMMVLIMSAYGLGLKALSKGIEGSIFLEYFRTVGLNFIVAIPAQLLIVGPISRWLLTKFIKPSVYVPGTQEIQNIVNNE